MSMKEPVIRVRNLVAQYGEKVILDDVTEAELVKIFQEMKDLIAQEQAPALKNKSFCRNCAYFEFCWE